MSKSACSVPKSRWPWHRRTARRCSAPPLSQAPATPAGPAARLRDKVRSMLLQTDRHHVSRPRTGSLPRSAAPSTISLSCIVRSPGSGSAICYLAAGVSSTLTAARKRPGITAAFARQTCRRVSMDAKPSVRTAQASAPVPVGKPGGCLCPKRPLCQCSAAVSSRSWRSSVKQVRSRATSGRLDAPARPGQSATTSTRVTSGAQRPTARSSRCRWFDRR